MGSGRAAVERQRAELGINRRARAAHLVAVHAITDARATAVPDQIEARDESPAENIGARWRGIPRHEAVRQTDHAARKTVRAIKAATALAGRVERDRAVRERDLGRGVLDPVAVDPAAL